MTDALLQQKLRATLNECATHLQRMRHAHDKSMCFLPARSPALQCLAPDQVETLDSYLYRFTKLQDAMGQRLFRQTLELLAEDTSGMAFIDQLNRLEQLSALPSARQWLDLRQLRNTLAHEYADDPEQLAKGINAAFESFEDLSRIYNQISDYVSRYLNQRGT